MTPATDNEVLQLADSGIPQVAFVEVFQVDDEVLHMNNKFLTVTVGKPSVDRQRSPFDGKRMSADVSVRELSGLVGTCARRGVVEVVRRIARISRRASLGDTTF